MYTDLIQLEEELDGFLYDYGYQLAGLRMAIGGQGRRFRIFIDRVDGQPVTISDCSELSPQIRLFLEMKTLYNDRSSLEVSSPGVDRELKRDRDFERFLGSEVKVSYFDEQQRVSIIGELSSFNDDVLVITTEGPAKESRALNVKRESLARVRIVPQLEV